MKQLKNLTATDYVRAFNSIKLRKHDKKMLSVHYSSPGKSITPKEMSKYVPTFKKHGHSNMHYGTLGRSIGKSLGIETDMGVDSLVEMNWPNGECVWTMRERVALALEELEWVDRKTQHLEFVETLEDIAMNVQMLARYLKSADNKERTFAASLIKLGRNFLAVDDNKNILFFPSRFVGYKNNSYTAHSANIFKDGTDTDPVISRILDTSYEHNSILELKYQKFCESNGIIPSKIKRKYWPQVQLEIVDTNQHMQNKVANDIESPPPSRIDTTISRIVRDTTLSCKVKSVHNYECQICGQTIIFHDGSRYAEAHHIHPLGSPHDGPDVLENIICVCPNHHAMCDFGAIRLVEKDLRKKGGHEVGQRYIDYHNNGIFQKKRN